MMLRKWLAKKVKKLIDLDEEIDLIWKNMEDLERDYEQKVEDLRVDLEEQIERD